MPFSFLLKIIGIFYLSQGESGLKDSSRVSDREVLSLWATMPVAVGTWILVVPTRYGTIDSTSW